MTTFTIPKFVYLDYLHKDFNAVWRRIEHDLLQTFGEPADIREGALTARWSKGITINEGGSPRGLYFRDDEDLTMFMLSHPTSTIR